MQNIGMEKNVGILWSKIWKTIEFQNTGMKSLDRLDRRKIRNLHKY